MKNTKENIDLSVYSLLNKLSSCFTLIQLEIKYGEIIGYLHALQDYELISLDEYKVYYEQAYSIYDELFSKVK